MSHLQEPDDDPLLDAINAASAAGDMEKFIELSRQMPVPPEVAKAFKESFGSDFVKNTGANLTAAEKAYGSDWLSR
jgi:hypothetical protein